MTALPDSVEEVRVVRVQPGDVIFVRTGGEMNSEKAEALKRIINRYWPDNEVLIGTADVEIAVVREVVA